MRQWELFGITDTVPIPQAPAAPPPPHSRFSSAATMEAAAEGRPVFFWSTDTALRVRTVTGAASEVVGLPRSKVEGRDLIAVFGMDGPNLELLDAHVAALNGETASFTLEGDRVTVRCRVAPTHDALDRVIGTFCLATRVERVDVSEAPQLAEVAVA
jgi:PAS domain-containing protein